MVAEWLAASSPWFGPDGTSNHYGPKTAAVRRRKDPDPAGNPCSSSRESLGSRRQPAGIFVSFRRPRSGKTLATPTTMRRLLGHFLIFLREEKWWWLAPLVVILLLLVGVLLVTGGSALAPLMYPVR